MTIKTMKVLDEGAYQDLQAQLALKDRTIRMLLEELDRCRDDIAQRDSCVRSQWSTIQELQGAILRVDPPRPRLVRRHAVVAH